MSVVKNTRNVKKYCWNRKLEDDFINDDVIGKTIDKCVHNYRVTDMVPYREFVSLPFDDKFQPCQIQKCRKILIVWNMNSRGAKLPDEKNFIKLISSIKEELYQLQGYTIDTFLKNTTSVEQIIKKIFAKVVEKGKFSFVAISKLLHFYLPNLFIPIDRTYTINYFTNYKNVDLPKTNLWIWFMSIHRVYITFYIEHKKVFKKFEKEHYPTKLLDAMVIGYKMLRDEYTETFKLEKIVF